MEMRIYILVFCFLAVCFKVTANDPRSKVVDLGRVIYSNDESSLLKKMQGFESHSNVAVKIYTTFRLHKNYDVDIVYTKELSGDNTIAIVVQTGWMSTITSDYEQSRYKDDLHIDRTENLNKQNLLPATMVEEIRRRMVDKFLNSTSSEQSRNLYYSLDYGVELLASLIYNPVAVKGSLIWESLWNRTDPYIMPEIAGFIDGCYNTYKSIPETDEAVEAATEVARDFAFNYALNRDGYRDAVNNLVTEALTDLDTYIKLVNGIVAAEDKIVNIYKGSTPEDRYWRGIIVFEVASAIFPLAKTKVAAKSTSGIRGLLDDLKKFKLRKFVPKSSADDLAKYIDDALADFYSGSNDKILTDIVDEIVLEGNNKKLAKIFGLDNSLKGKLVGNSGRNYELTAHNIFQGEELGKYPQYKEIKYFDATERVKYEVKVKDGKLIVNNELLRNKKGRIIFVMDENGKIYSGIQQTGILHHTSFLSGADVATAGEFKFINGVLEISPSSGHYVPGASSLGSIIQELIERGFDINKIKVNKGF
jgi:hypothetical protein